MIESSINPMSPMLGREMPAPGPGPLRPLSSRSAEARLKSLSLSMACFSYFCAVSSAEAWSLERGLAETVINS